MRKSFDHNTKDDAIFKSMSIVIVYIEMPSLVFHFYSETLMCKHLLKLLIQSDNARFLIHIKVFGHTCEFGLYGKVDRSLHQC